MLKKSFRLKIDIQTSTQKKKFLIDNNTTFDLVNLTFFNQTIWEDDTWTEAIMPLVKKYRLRTKNMLDFWCSEFKLNDLKREIEYNQYCEFFFCNYYSDSFEEWKQDELDDIKIEFREIDLMLRYQVERFNFPWVKKLLKQGAKPDVEFYDGDFSAKDRISTESAYLSTFVIPEFKTFDKKGYKQDFNVSDMFRNLLGFAAHEEMYHLLVNYKNWQKND